VGAAFISGSHFPAAFSGDLFFFDHEHSSLSHIEQNDIDNNTPYRVTSLADLKWWDTEEEYGYDDEIMDMLEGPDGRLYFSFNPHTGTGGIRRIYFIDGQ
jgi:glucose/arabinose dehydrogenase